MITGARAGVKTRQRVGCVGHAAGVRVATIATAEEKSSVDLGPLGLREFVVWTE